MRACSCSRARRSATRRDWTSASARFFFSSSSWRIRSSSRFISSFREKRTELSFCSAMESELLRNVGSTRPGAPNGEPSAGSSVASPRRGAKSYHVQGRGKNGPCLSPCPTRCTRRGSGPPVSRQGEQDGAFVDRLALGHRDRRHLA